jgi:protein-S-isoprenylcysteine O-methyltransferase Ste14
LFLILAPGVVAGYIPLFLLLSGTQINTGIFSYLAWLLSPPGIWIVIWCFIDFVFKGKGTPAPIDPPKELVVSGFYNYVRNPMYAGILLILAGHFLWFGYWSLLIYLVIVFAAFHAFVTLYEEPHLRRRFGAAYEEYLKRVPRWLPRFRK